MIPTGADYVLYSVLNAPNVSLNTSLHAVLLKAAADRSDLQYNNQQTL